MEAITEAWRVADVARRWKEQYFHNHQWTSGSLDKECIYNKITALGENATAEQVESIIGNGTWTAVKCHECGKRVKVAMQIGEPLDYESNTATICLDCLKAAAALLEGIA